MNILNKLWPWSELARLRAEIVELNSHLDIERRNHALTQARHQETSEELAKHKEAIQQKEGHIRKMVDIIALKGGFLKKSSILVVLFFCISAFGQGTQRQLFTTNPPPLLSVTAGPMVITNGGFPELTFNAGSLTNINTNGWSANAFNWVLSLATSASANATNHDWVIGQNATNNDIASGIALTNGGINNLSNYVNALGAAITNGSITQLSNYVNQVTLNVTNQGTVVSNGVVAHTVTVAGTANQITSSVGTAQQLANNPATTLAIANPLLAPGPISSSSLTNTGAFMSIDGLLYNWPATQTGGNLFDDGAGNLSWVAGTNVSSNIISAILTWPGPSNAVTVYHGFSDWFYASSTPVSLTNCVGATAGYNLTMDLCISNSSAATFTNFCTIPNAVYVGQNGNNQGTNALTIASGKQGFWHVEVRGVNRTNVYSTVEQ